jgi:molybdopterin biosynthesis enzyme
MTTKPERNIYLRMKTLDEARNLWSEQTAACRCGIETIPTVSALGRVLAQPMIARSSVPHYHGAAMDGIAVKAQDTFGASEVHPLCLVLGKTAHEVDTGDPLPPETDAVIMIEVVAPVGDEEVEIRSAAFPWQHVRKVGEDIVSGELLLPQHHRLRPADTGALLAGGVQEVPVYARPRVWIQPSGSELLPAGEAAGAAPGQIVEFNGAILSGLVQECGGQALLQGIVRDDYESIKRALIEAIEAPTDVVLINAGSSAGSEDYTPRSFRN